MQITKQLETFTFNRMVWKDMELIEITASNEYRTFTCGIGMNIVEALKFTKYNYPDFYKCLVGK